jgi:hypothetical protein
LDGTERLRRIIVRPGEEIGEGSTSGVSIEKIDSERLTSGDTVKGTARATDAERDDGFWFKSDGTQG